MISVLTSPLLSAADLKRDQAAERSKAIALGIMQVVFHAHGSALVS